MTISTALDQVGFRTNQGCAIPGMHREVISGVGATRTLKSSESGALCLLDRAAGVVYTLPAAPELGCTFEFLATVAVTSNSYKVVTGTPASEFLIGGAIMGDVTIATSGDYFEADGSTHVALTSNGSTTGGLLGERFTVTAISATQWAIHGVLHGAGTLATPFATS